MIDLRDKLESFPGGEFRTVYRSSLPEIAKAGLFVALEEGRYREFHEKLFLLPSFPHGIGVGVGIMAQTNVAGKILRMVSGKENGVPTKPGTKELAATILDRLSSGLGILGLGVSEPEWMGKLTNLKSVARCLPSGELELDFYKGFVTNGADAEGFLVVTKKEGSSDYGVYYIPRDIAGLELEEFHLEYAMEATHCKIKGEKLRIPAEYSFVDDYAKLGADIHLSEMLSAAVLFSGAMRKVVADLSQGSECRERFAVLGKLWDLSGLLYGKCMEISDKKDKDPDYKIEVDHPYGYEAVLDECFSILDGIPNFDRRKEYPDLGLFSSIHPARSPVYIKNRLKQSREWRKFGSLK
ncbi:acyl-CoA dehydrogenase [Leptospira langatensis]|uniref:Acyl-CoA dehydrogenase n=1 Tax=Leptospira langatensis TaxID=2484983 RepID=A0A5F1ZXN4_9LEPT|nr:acyl-CoA dehydrogenase [Leptospira langatensis]TGK04152.1 acyl-CoA dehydrogenase [Leptospira langatensis]TGL43632.1 acyl-CoA dehydrogenase [Leptospira langatensis]